MLKLIENGINNTYDAIAKTEQKATDSLIDWLNAIADRRIAKQAKHVPTKTEQFIKQNRRTIGEYLGAFLILGMFITVGYLAINI